MRYIPMSRYSIAEIEDQCRNAINRIEPKSEQELYNEVLDFCRWEHDVLIPA